MNGSTSVEGALIAMKGLYVHGNWNQHWRSLSMHSGELKKRQEDREMLQDCTIIALLSAVGISLIVPIKISRSDLRGRYHVTVELSSKSTASRMSRCLVSCNASLIIEMDGLQ
jgi:hypothetical protein